MKVVVVDIDPQGSLTHWYEERKKVFDGETGITHAQITGWRTQNEVEKLAKEHDLVLVDSPPHAETEAKIAIRVADLVIVPVQPSPMDLWATRPTLDLARQENIPTLIVLNRMPPRAKLADDLAAEVAKMVTPPQVDVAETRIGNRVAYAGALYQGRSVTEMGKRTSAAQEMSALAKDILDRTNIAQAA